MTPDPVSSFALWGAKLGGAAAGSAISVAYLLPRGRREAGVRFLIGVVTGIVFGPPAGLALAAHLRLEATLSSVELAMLGSTTASLCAWWALSILSRFANGLFRGETGRGKPGARD